MVGDAQRIAMTRIDPFGPPQTGKARFSSPGLRTNWWAVSGVVGGLGSLLPLAFPALPAATIIALVIAAASVAAGVQGVRKADGIEVGGRSSASVAVVIGVLSLIFWSLAGNRAPAAIKQAEVPRRIARQFIRDLAAGDRVSAEHAADALSVGPARIEQWIDLMETWGSIGDIAISGLAIEPNAHLQLTQCSISGTIELTEDGRAFEMDLVETSGRWIVTDLRFP
jgi:hypothetical protein